MNKKVFIFDMDGVIIDSVGFLYKVYLDFLDKFNIKGCKEEFNLLNGPKIEEIVFYLKKKHNLLIDYESLLKIYKDKIKDIYSQVSLTENIEKVLKLLKEKGFKIALASSAPREDINLILKRFKLQYYFDFIVSGDEVKESKPSPEIYLKVKDHFRDFECYVLEDSEQGIESASAAGLKVIFFNEQRKDLKQTIKNIFFEIKNMEELEKIVTDNLSIGEGGIFQKSNHIILRKLPDIPNPKILENKKEIEEIWQKILMEKGKNLFNGKLLNFVSKNINGSSLEIYGEVTNYKNFVAQNNNPSLKLNINPIGVSGMVVLNEDGKRYFLFGKRNSKISVTDPGFYELIPSGSIDIKYISGDLINYKKQLLEEFSEETGLSKKSVKRISEFALIFDQECAIYDICCVMETNLQKGDIIMDFKSKEYESPLLVSEDKLREFLKNNQKTIVPTSKTFLQEFIRKEPVH